MFPKGADFKNQQKIQFYQYHCLPLLTTLSDSQFIIPSKHIDLSSSCFSLLKTFDLQELPLVPINLRIQNNRTSN